MLMEANENMLYNFYCEKCHYGCCKKSSWDQHILTSKHINAKKQLIEANTSYICEYCNNNFKHQSSYCRHKKKCSYNNKISNDNLLNKDLITMLVKQNKDLMSLLKNVTNPNNT